MPAETFEEPSATRRSILRDLRQFRVGSGLTKKDVADELDWSPSKVIQIERGDVAISTSDLRALLALYKISDQTPVDNFVDSPQSSEQISSWDEYNSLYSRVTLTYLKYESSAIIIRQYEPLLIPGLLQIPEYTAALTNPLAGQSDLEAQHHVEARALRQEIFKRSHPPMTFFIVDEAVIRRQVGSASIMRHQLKHLEQMAELPTVTIQVVPFTAGIHPGLRGPFTLLGLASTSDDIDAGDTVLYLESRDDQVTQDDPELIDILLYTFWELEHEYASKPNELHAAVAASLSAIEGRPCRDFQNDKDPLILKGEVDRLTPD